MAPSQEGDEEEEEEASEDEGVGEIQLEEISDRPTPPQFTLPPQQNCAAHTMSLISINALKTVETESNTFKKMNRVLMGKVTALWNKVSRSPPASEQSFKILKRNFVTPCPTRWNSLYDSLKFISEQNQALLQGDSP